MNEHAAIVREGLLGELNLARQYLREAEEESTHGATANPRLIDKRVTEARETIDRVILRVYRAGRDLAEPRTSSEPGRSLSGDPGRSAAYELAAQAPSNVPLLCECGHYIWHHVTTKERRGCFPPEGCDCDCVSLLAEEAS